MTNASLFATAAPAGDDYSIAVRASADDLIRRAIDDVALNLMHQGLDGLLTPRQAVRRRFLSVIAVEEMADNLLGCGAVHPGTGQMLALLQEIYPSTDVLGLLSQPAVGGVS